MKQTFVFDRRLNRLDALHAFLGEVEHCNVSMCLVAVLEAAVPWEKMQEAVARAVHEVPRLQDVLRPAPWNLGPPVWARATSFEFDDQASMTALARGATWDDVLQRVDELQSAPFPEGRPPWQMEYLVGAPGGRAVIVLKLHHALSDGTALAVLLSKVFMRETLTAAGVEIEAVATPDPSSGMRELWRHWASTFATWWRTAGAVRPRQWREQRDVLQDFVRSATAWPQGQHAPARRSAMFRIPLGTWQACAKQRGGGVNELYLAIAARSLRRYRSHIGVDESDTSFRVVMPVDVRDGSAAQDGGNVTGAGILELSGSPEDFAALDAVEQTAILARQRACAAKPSLVDETVALLPGALQARALFRRFANKDLLATNVVVPLECEIHGVNVEMVFMVPPVIGPAASFALAGYGEALHLVLNMDTGLVRAPEAFAHIVDETLRELLGEGAAVRLTDSALADARPGRGGGTGEGATDLASRPA